MNKRTHSMKTRFRRLIGFLLVALMLMQLIGTITADAADFQSSSGSFEQAMPLTLAQKEVQRLFEQISSNAVNASRHADRLESFTRVGSGLHYETHAAELIRAKEAINAIGTDFSQLQELRPEALLWQQTVIDRMKPVLIGLAGHASTAIERLNVDRNNLPSPEYREAVKNVYAYAGQTRTLVSVHLGYAEAREKLNRLDAFGLDAATKSPLGRDEGTGVLSRGVKSLEQRVQSALLSLPYGVFDYLAFQVDGDRVWLSGEVSRPTLKTDAEQAVRGIESVASVTSDIKVLPLSPNDDRIRVATYFAIYGHSTMGRYRLNPNPPIRIIVENGHVTLKGVVGSDLDRIMAHVQANSVSGTFSVTNHLQVGS